MPVVKLDSAVCLTASCPEGRNKIDYFDQVCTGLVMEVRSSGTRTFALRFRDDHGRQRQVKIANVADISPSEARRIAQQLKSQAITGRNPAQERKDKRRIPTVAELSVRYLDYARTYKRSHDIDERYLRLHLLPRFGRLHLDQLDQTQIMDWLAGIRSLQHRKAFFAKNLGYVQPNQNLVLDKQHNRPFASVRCFVSLDVAH